MGDEGRILLDERHQASSQQSSKIVTFVWRGIFLIAVSLALTSKGLLISIPGPTVQYIARNTNSTVGGAALMVGGLSLGISFGAVAVSYVKSKVKDSKPLLATGILMISSVIPIAVTPFIHSLVLVVVLRVVIGFTLGYYATDMIAVYLRKWGKIGSQPLMQLHTLMFSFGAFLAPIVAKPFLELEHQGWHEAAKCRRPGMTSQHTGFNSSDNKSLFPSVVEDPVSWVFWVLAGFTFTISLIFFILASCKILDKIPDEYDPTADETLLESNGETSMKVVCIFLPSVFMFYFWFTAIQNLFGGYIYSIVVCSKLGMSVSEASVLNSVYWTGLISSRILAIIFFKYLKPSYLISADLTAIMTALIALIFWGESSKAVTWVCTFAVGFFLGPLFPSGISWCSTVVRTDAKYGFVFYSGGNLGSTLITPIGGILFNIRPFSVVYLVTGSCALTIVFFLIMILFAWYTK